METEYSSDGIPSKLTTHLDSRNGKRLFRRRAVLALINRQWNLVCCTVQELLPSTDTHVRVASRHYPQAILHEDLLTEDQCLLFASELQEGQCRIGDVRLQRPQPVQWQAQQLAVDNDFMQSAGYVVSLRFGQSGTRPPVRTLLAPNQPYYPDIEEAARDWLPFTKYHGSSDSRNEEVLFLLPEARAFIAGGEFLEDELLNVSVGGTEIGRQMFLIKGAYWQDKAINHFEEKVVGEKVFLPVPANADRLEYYLIDMEGSVCDFHRENRHSGRNTIGNVLGAIKGALDEQVRQAAYEGEGLKIEFKPFVDPEKKLNLNGQKNKLHEIVITVVAFANTAGGRIFLGINDDCSIVGIDQKFAEWTKGSIDDASVARYLGTLKSAIKDFIHGEVALHLSSVQVDSTRVVVIDVPIATSKPVSLKQDQYLYARTGASNRKVPPDQWREVLEKGNFSNYFQQH